MPQNPIDPFAPLQYNYMSFDESSNIPTPAPTPDQIAALFGTGTSVPEEVFISPYAAQEIETRRRMVERYSAFVNGGEERPEIRPWDNPTPYGSTRTGRYDQGTRQRRPHTYDEDREVDDIDEDDDEDISITVSDEDDDGFIASLANDTVPVPKAPFTQYSAVKARLKIIARSAGSSDAYRYLQQLIKSSAITRYGAGWTDAANLKRVQQSYIRLLGKYAGHTYIADEIDLTNLVINSDQINVRTLEGVLRTSGFTHGQKCSGCAITGESWLREDMYYTDRGYINPISYEELGYWHCDGCNTDRPFHEEDCQQCVNRGNHMEIGHLYNYSENVRNYIPQLFDIRKKATKSKKSKETIGVQRPKSKLYFGVEVEVVPRDGVTQQEALYWISTAMKEHALMKSDASLLGGGFEIVTAPATLEYHRNKLWNKLFTLQLPKGGKKACELVKSWTTQCCGTHIHFTKAALTDMQLAKFLVFYHDPKNARFLSSIAGRVVGPNAAYCHQDKKRLYFKADKKTGKVVSSTIMDSTGQLRHHEAVTVSHRNQGKTVEVRIFKGNVTKHGIMRSLEFVAATIEWCGINGVKELNYNDFLNWFDKPTNRARYPDLWKQLLSLRFLGSRHTSKNKKRLEELPKEQQAA